MGRLKKDHSGWHSHGLYLKYQLPSVVDTPKRPKAKKNTSKWCKGKVGVQHVIRRYFYYIFANGDWKRTNYIRSKCVECGKGFYSKDSSIPLDIPVEYERSEIFPVQVKVSGVAIPIDYQLYLNHHWCNACQMWERN